MFEIKNGLCQKAKNLHLKNLDNCFVFFIFKVLFFSEIYDLLMEKLQ